jgi:protein O-GlcNAc transferase
MDLARLGQLVQQGVRLLQSGKLPEAQETLERVLVQAPEQPDALHLLGLIAHHRRDPARAVELVQRAIRQRPDIAEFHINLGNMLLTLGRSEDALGAFGRALALKPSHPKALVGMGTALRKLGRDADAMEAFARATRVAPQDPQAWHGLGMTLRALERDVPAIEALRRCAELEPKSFAAWNNLGDLLRECGQLDDALACLQRALDAGGDRAGTYNNLGTVYRDLGRIPQAIASFRSAVAENPQFHQAYSNLLMTLHYDCVPPPDELFAEYFEWSRRFADPLAGEIEPHHNERDPDRVLRVGYVSADFRTHPIATFVEPILAAHDPQQVEVTCYSSTRHRDHITERMKSHAHHWHDVADLPDRELAGLIREHRIDILVDLSGHSAHNRLLVFARKPAPIQVTYLGHPDTSGLRTMDYRLTDAYHDPPGMTERFSTEALLRLQRSVWCYQSWTERAVAPLPARRRGHFTFGCLNTLSKITPKAIECWSEILRRVNASRLMLLVSAFAGDEARALHAAFAAHGIAPERIEFLPRCSPEDYMGAFDGIDLSLDPFPYNGLTSSCNSLWMGAPLVTLAGQTHASRAGVSLLSAVGLGELIARDIEQYQELAVRLASDLERLETMRAGLRQQMLDSPLMDYRGFTTALEQAYRKMWWKWCENDRGS